MTLSEQEKQQVLKHVGLAHKVFKKNVLKRNIDSQFWDDLLQDCYLGLCYTIKKYNKLRNAALSTFAYIMIKGYMLKGLKKLLWGVPTSINHKFVIRTIKRVSLEEISNSTELSYTIDEDKINYKTQIDLVENAIKYYRRLTKREREILSIAFHSEKTISEIGEMLGISRQAAHQAYTSGLKKLREYFSNNGVRKSSYKKGGYYYEKNN